MPAEATGNSGHTCMREKGGGARQGADLHWVLQDRHLLLACRPELTPRG